MKKFFGFVLLVICFSLPFAARAGLLQKASEAEVARVPMTGYFAEDDQAFKFASGPLAGKIIFFAAFDPSQEPQHQPEFVVGQNGKVVDAQALPGLMEGWNLVQTQAVTAISGSGNSAARILAVLTLEPLSGRSEDYWDQAFVFDVGADGKIQRNAALNKKIADKKPAIKTIEALKKYLEHP